MSVKDLELNEHVEMWLDAEDSISQKFADGLVYITVFNDKKQVDLKSLIKSADPKPKGTVPVEPTAPNFLDVTM